MSKVGKGWIFFLALLAAHGSALRGALLDSAFLAWLPCAWTR